MKLKLFIFLIGFFSVTSLIGQVDYYWVGGTGIWANLNNWETSTGVTPSEVPDANDNVIFNENSFQSIHDTVWILTKNPVCNNMIWENIPDSVALAGGADTTSLAIHGSLYFDSLVSNAYKGSIHFRADDMGNTITMNGRMFNASIYFNGTGGWILQDTLLAWDTTNWIERLADPTIENSAPDPIIYLKKGTLNTNGQTIISEGFSSTTQNPRHLIMENSDIYIIGGWSVNANGMNLEAGNSLITNRGNITNFNGTGKSLVYHNVNKLGDEIGSAGMIESRNLRTQYNYVEFFGGGNMSGDDTPGIEGQFTIDTVIMGFGPAPNAISGPIDSINYGRFGAPGMVNTSDSYIHKFVMNMGGKIEGFDNDLDSIFCMDVYGFNVPGKIVGRNFADYVYFQTDGMVASYPGSINEIVDAVFAGDGWLNGTNTYHNLHFSSGFWYQIGVDSLDAGGVPTGVREQTILNSLEVIGGCEGGMTLLSSSKKTVQGRLQYNGPGLTTEYLSVRDILKTGSGTVTINNGIDIDNNNGITFNEIIGRDLYWVGGNGFWDDNLHWSLIDGASSGDQCPPNIRDNVFVTDNSGLTDADSVKVNVKYACSNDQTWTLSSQALLIGPDSNNMRIWGSLEYSESMNSEFMGDYFFESEHDTLPDGTYVPKTIKLSGKEISKQTYFYGNNGAWILEDSLINMADTVFFKMGNLNTNGQTLRCYNFHSMDTLDRILSLDSSLIEVHQKGSDAWLLNGYHVDFYSGTSTIRSMGDLFLAPGEPPNQCHIRSMNGDSLVYYNIEFNALKSLLKSEGYCIYNLVDYLPPANIGEVVGGPATIDTLTFHEGAFGCVLKHADTVNVVMAYSINDTIKGMNSHYINQAYFFQDGTVTGYNWIGKLHFYEEGDILNQNTIGYCMYDKDGFVHGQNIFDTLIFTPGNKYFFQHDSIQTITSVFDVNGTCMSPIRMQSDSIGTQAKIQLQFNNPIVDFTSFRDLHALDYNGNIPYTGNHSIDLGNNVNWVLVDQPTDTLWWVDGTGDWGDGFHWSYTSGGDPIGCLPREENTVIFDENSFSSPNDTVLISIPNISCKSMLWTHSDNYTPVFLNEGKTDLFIYGDLLLSESMDYQFDGIYHFDEISGEKAGANTITTNGQLILNDIIFQGINGEWILMDSLSLLALDPPSRFIYLEHGKFVTNGWNVSCGGFISDYKNERELDIQGSEINLKVSNTYGWLIDGENLKFEAEGSTITNNALFSFISTKDGDTLKYYDIVINGALDSLVNRNNITEYNVIIQNGPVGWIGGNFIAEAIIFKGPSSGMFLTSQTGLVILDTANCVVADNHHIDECIVNQYGIITGHNDFDFFVSNSNCEFRGENTFGSLFLMPGKGNTFYFEELKTQTVFDTLSVRGNQCQNITLRSLNPNLIATIKQDSGIVSSDFLNIWNVGTEGLNSEFYAGVNSSPLPDPNDPPPGWIWDNAQGYIYGFGDEDIGYCAGDTLELTAINFNGDFNTNYYWNDDLNEGDISIDITEPGVNTIIVDYSENCLVYDTVNVVEYALPVANIDPGPFCEDDIIAVNVSPPGDFYYYNWSDGSDTTYTIATIDSTNIFVNVLDTITGCPTIAVQNIEVHETPRPEDYIGNDVILNFGQTIELDAGPGDEYEWNADDPSIIIPNADERYITAYGSEDSITYTVLVTNIVTGILNGCPAEASVKVAMYPYGTVDVPTAFSPNGVGPSQNEEIKVMGSAIQDLTFRIYNRYGELVFETTDQDRGWDGTYKGKKQEQEVYVYYLKAIFVDGEIVEKKGNITLLR